MKLLAAVLMLVVGCATEPADPVESGPTVGDAIDLWAATECDRGIKCGWSGYTDSTACVVDTHNWFCERYDCSAPMDTIAFDGLLTCSTITESASCAAPLFPCSFPF